MTKERFARDNWTAGGVHRDFRPEGQEYRILYRYHPGGPDHRADIRGPHQHPIRGIDPDPLGVQYVEPCIRGGPDHGLGLHAERDWTHGEFHRGAQQDPSR